MDRKQYWNEEYTKYWKAATKEADELDNIKSNIKKEQMGDFKTPGEKNIEELFSLLDYDKEDKLLDYGCGFGRFFPYFQNIVNYTGIDISESMISECKRKWIKEKERFIIAEGENLPFADGYFDKIICYGVFDACYQEQALSEMLRVLKTNGQLLITGKNILYFDDDEQAYIAEKAARKKNHPNFFTDVIKLKSQLTNSDILVERYYLYRGDFAKGNFTNIMPEKFYEWCLIIKVGERNTKPFESFSDMFSETYKRIQETRGK